MGLYTYMLTYVCAYTHTHARTYIHTDACSHWSMLCFYGFFLFQTGV